MAGKRQAPTSSPTSEEDRPITMDDVQNAAIGLFWTVVTIYCSWKGLVWCWRSCCRCLRCCCPCLVCLCPQRAAALDAYGEQQQPAAQTSVRIADAEGEPEVPVELLKKRKELCTSYFLLFMTGLLGLHHFYLERFVHGVLSLWTCNFFLVGWLFDLLLLPLYVSSSNKGLSPLALSDGSTRKILTRLPVASVLLIVVVLVAFCQTPPLLQALHIVDVEMHAAGTTSNPFEILGVSCNSSAAEVDDAALRKIKVFSLGKARCDKACKDRVSDLMKAQQFASGRAWRDSGNKERKPLAPGGVADSVTYALHCWQALGSTAQQGASETWESIGEKGLKEVGKEFVKNHFPSVFAWANSTREESSSPSPTDFSDDEL